MAALRLDVAARRRAQTAGRHLPGRAAGPDVQRTLRGRARAHPDEEHRLRGSAGGPARHRHRHRRGPHEGEVRGQAGAARLERAGNRARARLCVDALRVPAADSPDADGRDERRHPDRWQHVGGARLPVRRGHGGGVVPHHAVHVPHGGVQWVLPEVSPRPRDEAEPLRDPAGGGRTGGHRHGHRRRVVRRPRVHADLWARHLADERVPRPRLLRRGASRHLRRAAHRPVHGDADPHAAGRPDDVRLRLAWRHAAHLHLSLRSARGVRVRGRGVRSGRALPDAGVRPDGPRHRHERLDGAEAHLG